MSYVPIEMLFKADEEISRFKLVLTAASRANELAQGAKPLIESESKKVSTIAMQEIAAGKVRYELVKKTKKA